MSLQDTYDAVTFAGLTPDGAVVARSPYLVHHDPPPLSRPGEFRPGALGPDRVDKKTILPFGVALGSAPATTSLC
ncbi:hypothetical protein [Nocardia brevicatena]|uniref:hypothetical protein n=1 Tax=Nocardia brevicatena TaxID=37327 RepID=UPI0002E06253|nr:hypothetical protein [Nocardia brevicatena]